jgi:ankyrin repeat protein
MCGKTRSDAHAWTGCKCSKCGETCDKGHDWSKDCEMCARCRKRQSADHAWSGCKCSRCGRTRDEGHEWSGCRCSVCGKRRDEGHDWSKDCEKCYICGKTRQNQHELEGLKCRLCRRNFAGIALANQIVTSLQSTLQKIDSEQHGVMPQGCAVDHSVFARRRLSAKVRALNEFQGAINLDPENQELLELRKELTASLEEYLRILSLNYPSIHNEFLEQQGNLRPNQPVQAKPAESALSENQPLYPIAGTDQSVSFLKAAREGDLEKVKALLKSNAALVSARADDGLTGLHIAAVMGHSDLAELLLLSKADVNATDNVGATPLHAAGELGRRNVAELLLANGADVNANAKGAVTPLHHAAAFGHKDVVGLLLTKKAIVDARSNTGSTPLMLASARGHKEVAELLLKSGADIYAKDDDGWSPLHFAATLGDNNMVEFILANNADVNAATGPGDRSRTALHYAAYKGYQSVAEVLLANKADINTEDLQRFTPLIYAVIGGHKELEKLLREHGGSEGTLISEAPPRLMDLLISQFPGLRALKKSKSQE